MIETKIAHIGLNCIDPEITECYYQKHFGFVRAKQIDINGRRLIFLKNGEIRLELFQVDGALPDENRDGPTNTGFRHIAFQVDDIDAKLLEMGADVKVTMGPYDLSDHINGWKVVWVRDPDGRIVEISQGYEDDF